MNRHDLPRLLHPLSIARRRRPHALAAALALAGGMAGAQPSDPAAAPSPAGAAASPPAGPSGRPAEAPAPRPFADVIKDATRHDGFIPYWRKEEKVWLELPPEVVGRPLMLSVNISQSVGERGLYGSQMGPEWMVEFRRVGNSMQLIALNMAFRPGDDVASRQVVRQGFSDSLLAAAPVASAPHPDRKSVLVDAGFLLSDLPSYSTRLEAVFRLPFALDRANSSIEGVRSDAGLTTLNTRLHFAAPRLPAPPLVPPPVPTPPPPRTTPDPRSLFVGLVLNFARLPEQPMRPRLADPRIGHFTQAFTDFSNDLKPNPRVHYVQRWRLEKKDPAAEVSEPVKPITFWLDRNIPVRYRAAVTAGVLDWNAAFERIGIRNALVVRQQPDDAEFDTLDAGHASVRWFVGADAGFAIGPSTTDPRTGEILDADIGMSDVFTRGARRLVVEDRSMTTDQRLAELMAGLHDGNAARCTFAQDAAAEMQTALDLLEARGDIAPDSPEAEAFVNQVVRNVMAHEVGHTLGLKHNFKSSTIYTLAQLRDAGFTSANGMAGSVMDYTPYHLPLRGESIGSVVNPALGPYDHWAIEYAYRPLAAESESTRLQQIAARSTEPLLAFADDADADGPAGIDPLVNRFDLGPDPLAWYERRLALSRELWLRAHARPPQAGDDPLRTRRMVASGFRQLRDMPELASKYVGGMHTVRPTPGSGQAIYQPVDPAKQRAALAFVSQALFQPDSFRFRPEFLAAAGPDYVEWDRAGPLSIPDTVLDLQTRALDRLMSAGTARRVLDLASYLPADTPRSDILTLDEVYATVQADVWRELRSGTEIERMRRNLQREHLKRVQAVLVKPGAMPADALSLVRWHARLLQADLRRAGARSTLSVESRAHLRDSLELLTEALSATMQRG